jgi:hypothetical protein
VPPPDTADTIAGYWKGSWGELVLRVEGTSVRGVYQHDAGTVTGTYDPATRTFTGWWCEAYTRAPSGDAGEVEFRSSGPVAGQLSTLDGRWRYGSTPTWYEDWDLTRSLSEPPASLTDRFANTGEFCARP